MKRFLLFVVMPLVALIIGALIITMVIDDGGHVLIAYKNQSLQMSFWVGLLIVFVASGSFWFAVYFVCRLFSVSSVVPDWVLARKSKKSHARTTKGLIAFTEGDWASAKKAFADSASHVDTPLVNYLMAAHASTKIGDVAGSEVYLRKAEKIAGAETAVGITKAQLQYDNGHFEQCLASLLQLKKQSPKNKRVLSLLTDTYTAIEDWKGLESLLPELKKRKVFDTTYFNKLELNSYISLFASYAVVPSHQDEETIAYLKSIWKRAASHITDMDTVTLAYVDALVNCGEEYDAESTIRSWLRSQWSDDLVCRYGQVKGQNPQKQLSIAERWLSDRQNNSVLLLTLGRLAIMNNLLPKAQQYFESSIRVQRTPDALGELGRLLAHFDQHEKSCEYLVQSVVDGLPGQSSIDLSLTMTS